MIEYLPLYLPFAKPCKICGNHYDHDGHLLWKELHKLTVTDIDIHITDHSIRGSDGWLCTSCICCYCINKLTTWVKQSRIYY